MIVTARNTSVFILFFVFLFAASEAFSQKKPRKTTTKKPATTVIPPLDVRAAREKVEVQLENVDLFVSEYSPRADALELLDAAYAKKKVSDAKLAKHAENKKNIIQTIRNLRVGLAALESEFRTKPVLQKYLPQVQGITDLATDAEDMASTDKFVAAKVPLREISRHLADALAVLPK